MDVYSKLVKVKDDKYQIFQSKLVPNIDPKIILGVRTPQLRAIAKEIFNSKDRDSFLKDLPHKYYEENLIHFFVIGMIKDINQCIKAVEEFLPFWV